VKRALLVLALALVVVAPARAATRALIVDRGIVQSVSPTQIVLRGLDGSTLSFGVGPLTLVFVNGQPSSLAAIQPGFAAAVSHTAAGRAREIRAFGRERAPSQIDKGKIVSVSRTLLVLRQVDGTLVSVSVSGQTQVVLDGLPATLADLRPGYLAAALHRGAAPATRIQALRR
jgi:hypothetical protein